MQLYPVAAVLIAVLRAFWFPAVFQPSADRQPFRPSPATPSAGRREAQDEDILGARHDNRLPTLGDDSCRGEVVTEGQGKLPTLADETERHSLVHSHRLCIFHARQFTPGLPCQRDAVEPPPHAAALQQRCNLQQFGDVLIGEISTRRKGHPLDSVALNGEKSFGDADQRLRARGDLVLLEGDCGRERGPTTEYTHLDGVAEQLRNEAHPVSA